MKRLNNKGFAISTIFYSIIIIAVLIMAMLYSTLIFRKKSSNDFVDTMENNLNKDSVKWSTCALFNTSDSAKVGDTVRCGLENFHIVAINDMEVYLLSDNVLASYSNGDIKQISSDSTASIIMRSFSSSAYWTTNGTDINFDYGSKYPAFVFDNNSTIYQYVQKYQAYLNNKLSINSATATLINLEQADNIGLKMEGGTTIGDWVKIGYKWYTGVATLDSNVYIVNSDKINTSSYSQSDVCIRVVVRISRKALN
ncbi:MAG: hypothetical protein IKO49_06930 [Bacilli bacterium]|nr:hypothetical protein [Bacilli bacterium]